jgi:tetratricopeptide (TPR) repeat protein
MERTKNRLILLILLLSGLQIKASYRSEIYSAYINNQMDNWKNVIERMDAIPDKSNELLMELVNYQYGYIGYCIGFDKEDEAKRYLSIAHKNLDILDKNKYNPSLINAYKSAFYGFRIGLNPITAPVNGLKSIDCAKTAMKLDPQQWFGYVQHGNIQFYMPSTFGGSKREALKYYMKARELLEKEPESLSENWNYLSLMIVIGQTYTYLKDYTSARKVYEDILRIEPGFLYVKDDLYPKLLKKMEN